MKFVDQALGQILANGRRAAADADILVTRRGLCLFKCRVDAVGYKVERRTAFHLDWIARMVSKDKCGHVVRRFVAPPAFPVLIGPGTTNWSEHISAEDPGTFVSHTLRRKGVIHARLAALEPMH